MVTKVILSYSRLLSSVLLKSPLCEGRCKAAQRLPQKPRSKGRNDQESFFLELPTEGKSRFCDSHFCQEGAIRGPGTSGLPHLSNGKWRGEAAISLGCISLFEDTTSEAWLAGGTVEQEYGPRIYFLLCCHIGSRVLSAVFNASEKNLWKSEDVPPSQILCFPVWLANFLKRAASRPALQKCEMQLKIAYNRKCTSYVVQNKGSEKSALSFGVRTVHSPALLTSRSFLLPCTALEFSPIQVRISDQRPVLFSGRGLHQKKSLLENSTEGKDGRNSPIADIEYQRIRGILCRSR